MNAIAHEVNIYLMPHLHLFKTPLLSPLQPLCPSRKKNPLHLEVFYLDTVKH